MKSNNRSLVQAAALLMLGMPLKGEPGAFDQLRTLLPAQELPLMLEAAQGAPQETELSLVSSSDPQDPKFTVGQIFAPCAFGDHATKCLLDSGASMSLVKEADFSSEFRTVDIGLLNGVSGETMVVAVVEVPRFSLGPAGLGTRQFVRYPDVKSCGGQGLFASQSEGLVGMDVLFPDSLELSFGARNVMRVNGPAHAALRSPLTVSKERKILMPVTLGKSGGTALWDTGYGLSAVEKSYVASHPQEFSPAGEIDSYDISCARTHETVYKVKSLEIGGQSFAGEYVTAEDFKNVRQITGSPDLRMVIGFNLATQLDWSLDFKNKRWGVTRSAAPAPAAAFAANSLSGSSAMALRRPGFIKLIRNQPGRQPL